MWSDISDAGVVHHALLCVHEHKSHVEWCIRQLWCSSVISYRITRIAHNHHTNIYSQTSIYRLGKGIADESFGAALQKFGVSEESIKVRVSLLFLGRRVEDGIWYGMVWKRLLFYFVSSLSHQLTLSHIHAHSYRPGVWTPESRCLRQRESL